MNVHVIHVTKYSAAIGSRQTNSSSFHPRSVDPSDNISECSVVAIPFAVAIPFGNLFRAHVMVVEQRGQFGGGYGAKPPENFLGFNVISLIFNK